MPVFTDEETGVDWGLGWSPRPGVFRFGGYLCLILMFAVSTAMTTTSDNIDVNEQKAVLQEFGYNSITMMWDSSPAKEAAALLYGLAEYCFASYLLLDWVQATGSANVRTNGIDKGYCTLSCKQFLQTLLLLVQLLLLLSTRLMFVMNDDDDGKVGGTGGYLCLLVFLLVIFARNAFRDYRLTAHCSKRLGGCIGFFLVLTFVACLVFSFFYTRWRIVGLDYSAKDVEQACLLYGVGAPFVLPALLNAKSACTGGKIYWWWNGPEVRMFVPDEAKPTALRTNTPAAASEYEAVSPDVATNSKPRTQNCATGYLSRHSKEEYVL